jgi:hypothetical protein
MQTRTTTTHSLAQRQSEALTGRLGRSPLRGCHPHARRAQTRSQMGSVDAHSAEARVTASSMARDSRAMLGRAFPIDVSPSSSLHRPSTRCSGVLYPHMAHPDAQGARQAASTMSTPTQWPVSQQTPGSLTRRPPFHHPFWPAQHAFHAHQAIQLWPSSMARNQHAILGHAFPIDGGTTTTSYPQSGRPPLGVATSQPAPGMPIGRQSSGSCATSPAHMTRVSHTQRSAAHRRDI